MADIQSNRAPAQAVGDGGDGVRQLHRPVFDLRREYPHRHA